jgi:hypothetical protein
MVPQLPCSEASMLVGAYLTITGTSSHHSPRRRLSQTQAVSDCLPPNSTGRLIAVGPRVHSDSWFRVPRDS